MFLRAMPRYALAIMGDVCIDAPIWPTVCWRAISDRIHAHC